MIRTHRDDIVLLLAKTVFQRHRSLLLPDQMVDPRNTDELYTKLYQKSLDGDADCGGVLVCNYLAGEGITHLDKGRPLVVRSAESKFTLTSMEML